MSCSCVHNRESIETESRTINEFRELFIKRMTVDSITRDRRRRDYNQAVFGFRRDGRTYMCFNEIDLDMILQCFDNAAKDLRREWCDVESCRRK